MYTNVACGAKFADEFAFDGSQNQPNSMNASSAIYDTRTNSYSYLPYKNSSYICVDGVGESCTQYGDRSETLLKETSPDQTDRKITCAYNMPFTSA